MHCLYRWTVGKQPAEPLLNEDALACADTRGIYAISDGASESFASRRWARVLVTRYVRCPVLDAAWLVQSIGIFNSNFDRTMMSWSAQAAFDRGSFATLLGLQYESDASAVTILGIGDSLAVLDDGEAIQATFPYTDPEQYRANPLLLSTIHDRNAAILGVPTDTFVTRWEFGSIARPKVFCMTDALGAWLLSDRGERMTRLRTLRSRREFVELIDAARAEGTMRRDDTTLLVIG